MTKHLTDISIKSQNAKDETTHAIYSQAQEIGNIAGYIDNMTRTIERVAENALNASLQANEADQLAIKGKAEVDI